MAEYIDREQIKWHCEYENPQLCDKEDCKNNCSNLECSYQEVMQIPTADVVERGEYERVLKNINFLSQQNGKNLDTIFDLRSKIDKAIAEIEELKHKNTDVEGYRWWNNAIENVLHILERNIGE